jgi:molybdopterin molybdotransferase
MIPFEKALEIVLGRAAREVSVETVTLAEAAGRVMAREVRSDMDFPPFDKSAMDGYACRASDVGSPLEVLEVIAAGMVPTREVTEGRCSKIMTGAMLPTGAEVVFRVEESEVRPDGRVRFVGSQPPDNVSRKGEDLVVGDIVVAAGTLLDAKHIAVLASVGCVNPVVACRPRVGIIATGDELVEPAARPGPGQIRNSNSWQLAAQVERIGGVPHYYGIMPDRTGEIEGALRRALAENDIVLMSGGVSMGDFDLVPEIMTGSGVEILFDRIAIKPGKPSTFGVAGNRAVFGMPGNPVSTFVIFEVLVRPFIRTWMGCRWGCNDPVLALESDLVRRRADRTEWMPVQISERGGLVPVRYNGSAHFLAISRADGLIPVPAGVYRIEQGSRLPVRRI